MGIHPHTQLSHRQGPDTKPWPLICSTHSHLFFMYRRKSGCSSRYLSSCKASLKASWGLRLCPEWVVQAQSGPWAWPPREVTGCPPLPPPIQPLTTAQALPGLGPGGGAGQWIPAWLGTWWGRAGQWIPEPGKVLSVQGLILQQSFQPFKVPCAFQEVQVADVLRTRGGVWSEGVILGTPG